MPLTNAEKQKAHRQRQRAKLARYEAALREIAGGSVEDPRIMADIAATALAPELKP